MPRLVTSAMACTAVRILKRWECWLLFEFSLGLFSLEMTIPPPFQGGELTVHMRLPPLKRGGLRRTRNRIRFPD